MCARNPKETDTDKQLVEVFTKSGSTPPNTSSHLITEVAAPEAASLNEMIKPDIGFHFHNALKLETETH